LISSCKYNVFKIREEAFAHVWKEKSRRRNDIDIISQPAPGWIMTPFEDCEKLRSPLTQKIPYKPDIGDKHV
jgi:hypothetical protein